MARRIHSSSSSSSSSFFGDLRARELGASKAPNLPYIADLSSDLGGRGRGVLAVEHFGGSTPPLAISSSKSIASCRLLAVSDEDGFVSVYDTHRNLPSCASSLEKSAEARVCDWVAHNNAIFDVCWLKDDAQILTASGDQTIKIWDAENRKCLGILVGHTGSVKSLCSHSSNADLVVSGSRDGSIALWDLRCMSNSTNSRGEARFSSAAVVKEAHSLMQGKRARRGKAASMSITSVLYLKDDVSIASAGAVDRMHFLGKVSAFHLMVSCHSWQCSEVLGFSEPKISSFSNNPHVEPQNGKHLKLCVFAIINKYIIASKYVRIYLYDVIHLHKGPMKVFSGSRIESFFVKSAISPDRTHILGGSSDGNAYIWQVFISLLLGLNPVLYHFAHQENLSLQVEKPEEDPVILTGHEGEVTAVDWFTSEVGKIATCSDDFTVRVWNIGERNYKDANSPTAVRKRYPESAKKRNFGSLLSEGLEMQKSPEAELSSPSSVLNPPPSLKRRTICDYFVTASES
uniref:Denticleless protein homolog n=1 Tax=Ananas comosus var. bracteatus TaxID=296719 RepID=A0A6V7PPD7_ANACO|nr:unnamed protein product [Ananas comosus var. bracteatus]